MTKLIALAALLCPSLALADNPKAPAPPPNKDAMKKAPPPEAKPEKPAPPTELAEMAKAMGGTWKCTGTGEIGGKMVEGITGVITHKTDLDGYWIQSSLTLTVPKMGTMHTVMFTTYDAKEKKWFRSAMNGHGGHSQAWGTHEGTKTSWEGEADFGGTDVKMRATDEMVSPKEVHVTGEYSKDNGKTWVKDHDATCKK